MRNSKRAERIARSVPPNTPPTWSESSRRNVIANLGHVLHHAMSTRNQSQNLCDTSFATTDRMRLRSSNSSTRFARASSATCSQILSVRWPQSFRMEHLHPAAQRSFAPKRSASEFNASMHRSRPLTKCSFQHSRVGLIQLSETP